MKSYWTYNLGLVGQYRGKSTSCKIKLMQIMEKEPQNEDEGTTEKGREKEISPEKIV